MDTGTSILPWIQETVGARLLSYLLGCNADELDTLVSGHEAPNKAQAEVISTLSQLRQAIPGELDDANAKEIVRGWLMQPGAGGLPAKVMHEHTVGKAEPPPATDKLESSLLALAMDVYPALLLSPDAAPMAFRDVSFHVSSLAHRHPQARAFFAAAVQDPVLKNIFAIEYGGSGRVAMVYQNTGNGGSLQLWLLPERILMNAWRHLQDTNPSPTEFALEAGKCLRLVQDVLAGKTREIALTVAFTGVLLPPGSRLELSHGTIRPVTEADRRLAPEGLRHQLEGTDSSGTTTKIGYDGDVILEYPFRYRVRAVPGMPETPSWPDMQRPSDVDQALLRLRFSLMLAVEREVRPQLIPTWRYHDEPLSHGGGLTWADPRLGASIMPTTLTDAEVTKWGEWYDKLRAAHVEKIEVALSRILRAIAERRETSDVLIDSVIAWENLFGTKEGEPTFRMSMCLAALLEQEFEARKRLKKELGDIYGLRSKVVHGSGNLKPDDHPKCQRALDVAVAAVRVLVDERPDILALPDGAARSTALLLNQVPASTQASEVGA